MCKLGKIYIIKNDINKKVYIGQTVQSLNRRFNGHCCYDKSNGRSEYMYIKRAIHKYGREHFTINLIEECSIEMLNEREKYWISYYDSYNNGYNLTEGGQDRPNFLKHIEDEINIEEFKSFIINNNPPAKEVEKKFNICHSTVYNILKRLNDPNLKLNPNNPRKPKIIDDINKDELILLYNHGWSIIDLVKRYHVKKNKISNYLKSCGIDIRRGVKGYESRI